MTWDETNYYGLLQIITAYETPEHVQQSRGLTTSASFSASVLGRLGVCLRWAMQMQSVLHLVTSERLELD